MSDMKSDSLKYLGRGKKVSGLGQGVRWQMNYWALLVSVLL